MNDLQGYKKYEKLMADFAPTFLEPIVQKKLKDYDFYIEQTGIEFLICKGFSEISTSFDTLKLIESFININPPKNENINYSNYLIYHIHNYLQEMYIMKDRLDRYIELINKNYKKKIGENETNEIKENLKKIIKSAFNNITKYQTGARSKHVHDERYMDEELKWLSSTTLLSNFHDEFKIESEQAYLVAKDKWFDSIKNNNQELEKILDMYFNAIYIIITLDDKVTLPNQAI